MAWSYVQVKRDRELRYVSETIPFWKIQKVASIDDRILRSGGMNNGKIFTLETGCLRVFILRGYLRFENSCFQMLMSDKHFHSSLLVLKWDGVCYL